MTYTTLDLSKYDALTAYKGCAVVTVKNPIQFFPDTESVRRCVCDRMSSMGLDTDSVAQVAHVTPASVEELVQSGLTSIRDVYKVFDVLHIRTETLPAAYAGRVL